MTREEQLQFGLLGVKSAPKRKVIAEAYDKPRKHAESTLHLTFCKWVRKTYPELKFVRHEREKSRSYGSQNLMQVYNNLDGLPDMEIFTVSGLLRNSFRVDNNVMFVYTGLYLEFKKPGENWLLRDGKTVKPSYAHQYACHQHLWSIGRCAYFANDLETAKKILISYLNGTPIAKQEYIV